MRTAMVITLLISLTGCYCVPDKGDSPFGSNNYFSGCWDDATKNIGKPNKLPNG